jgi:predicted nucleic acid-binding Zn ribbon protein
VRRAPRRLDEALAGLTGNLAPATTLAAVQVIWADVVGPTIAAAAQPVAERDGLLTLACEASAWAQELDLLAPELLGRLNAALGGEPLQRLRSRLR